MLRPVVAILLILGFTACGQPEDTSTGADRAYTLEEEVLTKNPAEQTLLSLPEYFDCIRENKGVLVAAHRGGPTTGYPENALETLQYGLSKGISVFEIDVAETKDGVLTLMHDDRLNRTSTGDGYVSDTDWATMSRLKLVAENGKQTDFSPPKLTDVLLWAKQSGAILELDRKPSTSFKNLVSAVHSAGAENNVLLISYTDEQAGEIARADNELMLTASARGDRDIAKLEALGVDRTRLVAWMGTTRIDEAAWSRVLAEGVEPAFGTLGRRGERLDDAYWVDGKGDEYQLLVDKGLVLIATDEPYRVADALSADDMARQACGR